MARRRLWLGSVGPYLFDTDSIYTDKEFHVLEGVKKHGIAVDIAEPAADYHGLEYMPKSAIEELTGALEDSIALVVSDVKGNAASILVSINDITILVSDVAGNIASIQVNATNISTNVTDIAGNTSNITQNATDISSNVTDIGGNTTNITQNATDISSNATDISGNTTNITQNATDISSNASDISGNTTNIGINASGISANVTDIAGNASNITVNAGNISTNVADISGNASDITSTAADIQLKVSHNASTLASLTVSNINGGAVVINGLNIELNGDTTVDGTFTVTRVLSAASGQRVEISSVNNNMIFYDAGAAVITIDDSLYGTYPGISIVNGVFIGSRGSGGVIGDTVYYGDHDNGHTVGGGGSDEPVFWADIIEPSNSPTGISNHSCYYAHYYQTTNYNNIRAIGFRVWIEAHDSDLPAIGFHVRGVNNTTGDACGLLIDNAISAGGTAYAIKSLATEESYFAGDIALAAGKDLVFDGSGGDCSIKWVEAAGETDSLWFLLSGGVVAVLNETIFSCGGLIVAGHGIRATSALSGGSANTNTITGGTDTPTAYDETTPDGYIKAYVGTQAVTIPYWNT